MPDAKLQTVTLEYDAAGRLAYRYEPEGTTAFTFYPYNASAGQAGRLQQVGAVVEEAGLGLVAPRAR